MSSKHPVTTTESVTILAGRTSPETTSDYSGSGDPTLVQWRRRPYEAHAYPHCTASESGGSGSGTVGATNPSFAIEFPPRAQTPSKPVEDLDFDSKPSATYQSLTDLSRSAHNQTHYYTTRKSSMDGGKEWRRGERGCSKCSVFSGLLAMLALLVACAAAGISVYGLLSSNEPEEANEPDAKIVELETMLASSTATIRELNATLEDLRRSISTKELEIGALNVELNRINRSVESILSPTVEPTNSALLKVNLTQDCMYTKAQVCSVAAIYTSCSTPAVTISSSGTFIQDAYCAVTNLNGENNPSIATLRHDEASGTLLCLCYVTGSELRSGAVDCALFVRRCPAVVNVN